MPDGFTAAITLAAARNVWRKRSSKTLGLMAAGCFLYLGAIDINFNLNNDMYGLLHTGTAQQKMAMLLELVINIYCVFICVWYAVFFTMHPSTHAPSAQHTASVSTSMLQHPQDLPLPIVTPGCLPQISQNDGAQVLVGSVVDARTLHGPQHMTYP
jgi:hypothetical protein